MSLLTMIRAVANELGLPEPATVMTATDQQTITMLALANREGNNLSNRARWQELLTQATFTTVATELQGLLTTIAPGFKYMLGKTMWNRSLIQPVYGGMYPEDWQLMEAYTVTGPYPKFRIKQGGIYFLPVPTAGQTVAFEYMSKNWCASSGGTGQQAWADDTDVGVLEEDLMLQGIKWRYLAAKGMDYSQEIADYEAEVADAMTRGQVLRDISVRDSIARLSSPGVPTGNWSIS